MFVHIIANSGTESDQNDLNAGKTTLCKLNCEIRVHTHLPDAHSPLCFLVRGNLTAIV